MCSSSSRSLPGAGCGGLDHCHSQRPASIATSARCRAPSVSSYSSGIRPRVAPFEQPCEDEVAQAAPQRRAAKVGRSPVQIRRAQRAVGEHGA